MTEDQVPDDLFEELIPDTTASNGQCNEDIADWVR